MLLFQVGQCGNQVGLEFWSQLLKFPSKPDPIFSELSGVGVNAGDWHLVRQAYPQHDAWHAVRRQFFHDDGSARGIVVDSEPKVIDFVAQTVSKLAQATGARTSGSCGIFRENSLISEHCGRGNNWALGYYGGRVSRMTSHHGAESSREPNGEAVDKLEYDAEEVHDPSARRPKSASRPSTRRWVRGRPIDGIYSDIQRDERGVAVKDQVPEGLNHPTTSTAFRPAFIASDGQAHLGLFSEGEDARSLSSRSLEAFRSHLEKMDYVSAVCFAHALSGGTGSGLGSRLTEDVRDMIGAKPTMLHIAIAPFRSGEIALQHYNCALTLATLQNCSDAIWLASNDDIFAALSLGQVVNQNSTQSSSSSLLSSFAAANRYTVSSFLDFLTPTQFNMGTDSSIANTWGDPALQLYDTLASVCPISGTKLFELWNSSSLVYNSPTPVIPQVSLATASAAGVASAGAANASPVLFNGSWTHHLTMLTRCVPKGSPWHATERAATGDYALLSNLVAEAKRDATGRVLDSVRSEVSFPSDKSAHDLSCQDVVKNLSIAEQACSDSAVLQKTLAAQAVFHGCRFGSVSSGSATRATAYAPEGRALPKALAFHLMEPAESNELERSYASLKRLFPTPTWLSNSHNASDPLGRFSGLRAALSPASSLSAYVAVTGPAVLAAIQQHQESAATAMSGRALVTAQSTASGVIRRRLAGSALDASASSVESLGRTVSLAINRGRVAQSLVQCVRRCTEMLSARAYLHWFERCGCTESDIAEAAETVYQIIDNYRCMLK